MNRAHYLENAAEVSVPAGSRVFAQGQSADNYLLVVKGCVKVFARSDEGREVVLYRVSENEMCTLTTACLLGDTAYPAEAIAEVDTVARVLPAREFDQLLEESPEFRRFVFASFSGRLNEIMQRFEQLVLAGVDKRLAFYMLHHSDDGIVRGTHEQIAMEIGTAREVVSRHLKALERKNLIRLHRGEIHIRDPQALEALI